MCMNDLGRIFPLNTIALPQSSKTCVVYVMGRDQRVHDNYALLEAYRTAKELNVPFAVIFCLHHGSSNRAREHYQWMIKGLKELEQELDVMNIPFMLLVGKPSETLPGIAHHLKPAAIFFDFNPLKGPVRMQKNIADNVECPVYVVDTHNIVPTWEVSDKQEFAARTIRPKIQKLIDKYIDEPQHLVKQELKWPGKVKKIVEMEELIDKLFSHIPSNSQDLSFVSGEKAAQEALKRFITHGLRGYEVERNDPSLEHLSELSPYLHFGQLSRLRAFIDVEHAAQHDHTLRKDADAFIEELNVRSALSDNYCYFNNQYDSLEGAADWAKKTLASHSDDKREHNYTLRQLEDGETEDQAWNAAQHQLTQNGKMHGYMRMYWAKKILEWSPAKPLNDKTVSKDSCFKSINDELSKSCGAEWAIKVAIALNDFYSIDGGDPNGYVGILWSIAGLHDRAWFGRPVFGSIRYMNYGGLKRKFNITSYIERYNG